MALTPHNKEVWIRCGLVRLVLLISLLAAGCAGIKIVQPGNGAQFAAGEPIRFQVRAEGAFRDKVEWIIDGAPAGTGESFVTAKLSTGWHEAAAVIRHGDRVLGDRVRFEVAGWHAVRAPNRAPIRALARDAVRRETWLAVPDEGVYRIGDSGQTELFSRKSGDLPSDRVRDITQRDAETWVATDAGVARYDGLRWQTYTRLDGLPGDDITALAVNKADSHLWVATTLGLARWDGARWHSIPWAISATALAVSNGIAWAGTDGKGVHRLGAEGWELLSGYAELENDRVMAIIPDWSSPRSVWILAARQGLLKYHDGSWERFNPDGLDPLGAVGMALEEKSRSLWIAEADGRRLLTRSANGLWHRYHARAALPAFDGPWRAIAVDPATGTKWLATDTHLISVAATGSAVADADLPDMVAHAPTAISWQTKGPLLVLESTVRNAGDGPLEMEAKRAEQSGQRIWVQNVYHGDKVVQQHPVGEQIFAPHPDHSHYHVDAFMTYQLREVLPGNGVGAILRQSPKVSFCLNDFARVNPYAEELRYRCTRSLQGVSVGWADTYAANLAGQSIPVDGIAPGEYWVVVIVTSAFAEKDYGNNIAMTRVRLSPKGEVTVVEERDPTKPSS